ncbi:MAG: NAD-dependent epimerase/dehydratase family protein [Pseudorhodobacter sp.]|nr:NAD-dependent epimerase/dehydratase family protein [Frankiaceae bacterium]
MRAIVTGAAGFIGSHLCERLLGDGHSVVAVDCLTPYYDPSVKRSNLALTADHPRAQVVLQDITSTAVLRQLADVDVVFHLAAQPGVRPSWASFSTYLRENVERVHVLLEAAHALRQPPRIVLASSSSVYGDALSYPCGEGDATMPVSPYGVSKLCMERLAAAYVNAYGLPVVALRYFTVYGPRQRPDMAFSSFLRAALTGEPVAVYGDGEQVREYTYVSDVVEATVRAGLRDLQPGTTLNICGGEPTTDNEVLALVSELAGRPVRVVHQPPATGDVRRTGGTGELAATQLGWRPRTSLLEGLGRQVEAALAQHLAVTTAAG